MKTVNLTQNKIALISDQDWERISRIRWHAARTRKRWEARHSGTGKTWVRMAKFILQTDCEVDHVNGDALDNQRDNLRVVTRSQNNQNRKARPHSSKFKGVHWLKRARRWQVSLRKNGKKFHLGYFKDEVEAGKAYDRAALIHFGEFARTNEMEGLLGLGR